MSGDPQRVLTAAQLDRLLAVGHAYAAAASNHDRVLLDRFSSAEHVKASRAASRTAQETFVNAVVSLATLEALDEWAAERKAKRAAAEAGETPLDLTPPVDEFDEKGNCRVCGAGWTFDAPSGRFVCRDCQGVTT